MGVRMTLGQQRVPRDVAGKYHFFLPEGAPKGSTLLLGRLTFEEIVKRFNFTSAEEMAAKSGSWNVRVLSRHVKESFPPESPMSFAHVVSSVEECFATETDVYLHVGPKHWASFITERKIDELHVTFLLDSEPVGSNPSFYDERFPNFEHRFRNIRTVSQDKSIIQCIYSR
jgi:dihydrofolate reductase